MQLGRMGQPELSIGKLVNRIKSMTELNDHGEAYLLAAKTLGCDDLVETFAGINRRQLELGHLPVELNEERYKAYKALMKFARANLRDPEYQEFHAAF